jgi:hypothetical protein
LKKLIISLALVLPGILAIAQSTQADTSYWKKGGMGTLAFAQVSFYQWASGGENSYSANGFLNLFANYKKENVSWDNSLGLGYGLLKQGLQTKKSDDRIDLSSQFGMTASGKWNYSSMLGFKTQFGKGYNYPDDSVKISDFFSPAYLTTSLGMDYKPNDRFSIFLSPLTGKMTFVVDNSLSSAGAFGVDPGKKFRAEFGGYAKITYVQDIMKNVNLQAKMDLFSNYLKKPGNVDVSAEFLIVMKINEFLAATFNTLLIYDDDVNLLQSDKSMGPGLQVKEVFGVGLSYKF